MEELENLVPSYLGRCKEHNYYPTMAAERSRRRHLPRRALRSILVVTHGNLSTAMSEISETMTVLFREQTKSMRLSKNECYQHVQATTSQHPDFKQAIMLTKTPSCVQRLQRKNQKIKKKKIQFANLRNLILVDAQGKRLHLSYPTIAVYMPDSLVSPFAVHKSRPSQNRRS